MSNISDMACWSTPPYSLSYLALMFITFCFHDRYDTRMAVVTIYIDLNIACVPTLAPGSPY